MKKHTFSKERTFSHAGKGYSKIFNNKWFTLLLLVLFAAGCKKVIEETGLVGICPTVILTSPLDTASGTSLTKRIDATFSKPMNPASISTSSFTLFEGSNIIQGKVTYSGSMASFTPTLELKPNSTYTGTITTGASDMAGNAMIADYVWRFKTGAGPDRIAPTVTSTDPADAATAVAFNKRITASFSEPMDTATISTTSFTIKNTTLGGNAIAGTVSYTGTTAVFSPSADLAANTTYLGTISTKAKDLAGNPLAANYTWNFTTGTLKDVLPPTVVLTDPANLAIGVAFNKKINAAFSEAMDPATITTTTFALTQGATVVPGVINYTGTMATFSPANNLSPNTVYTATISKGARDLAGNAIAQDYVWSFTTGVAPDIIPPVVISTDPVNTATGVAVNKKLSAAFSEAMDPLTITTANFTLQNGATLIAGTVLYSGPTSTAVFTPANDLTPGTTYKATITTGSKDLAGNALASNYVWTFTTPSNADVTAPTVLSTDPLNLATGVALNKMVSATFSEAMNPSTINTNSFILSQNGTAVFGIVSYSGTTATFSANLLSNTVYTATIKATAKDLAGNAIITDHVWTFTTLTVIPPPNLGTASIFGAFGGNAGVTNEGLFTIINNGSLGTTAASTLITGFHDGTTADVYTETPLNKGTVTGRIYTAPPAPGTAVSFVVAQLGLADAIIAYNSISPASKPGGIDPGAGELGGLTLAPGVYKSASGTFKITNGDLTLDAKGDANAVWIFQTDASLTVGVAGPAGARNVKMINGGLAKNVFWYVGSSATINGAGGGVMSGNIIASAGVTFSTSGNVVLTVLNGRALSLNASVTMVNTVINVP